MRSISLKSNLAVDCHDLLTPQSVEKIRGDPSIGRKGLRKILESVERLMENHLISGENQGIVITTLSQLADKLRRTYI